MYLGRESGPNRRPPYRVNLLVLAVLGVAASAPGQSSIRWTTNHYDVVGTTARELRQSINEMRPWQKKLDADGLTNWRLDWRFTVTPSAGGCRISSFSTTTTISVTLPRWTGLTNAPDRLRKTWERYITALGQHEAGHGQHALAAATELQKRVKDLPEHADCDGLRRRIQEIGNATIEEYRRREKDYDERTRHGATQGATLW